jgi:hypothetical protein
LTSQSLCGTIKTDEREVLKMNKSYIEMRMEDTCKYYDVNFRIEGEDWQYDNTTETVICPVDWQIEDDTDKLWREVHEISKTNLASVPQFIFNLYHEIGHHENPAQYEETALRKILNGLAEISKEISLRGYFELPSEQDATNWALEEIAELLENETDDENFWWEN